jgi:hypothetical protein
MALPERIANSPEPGTVTALTTLSEELPNTEGAAINVKAAAPAALQGEGQAHFVIDSEIIVVDTTTTGTTKWTVLQRGAEGTTKAAHAEGAEVFNLLTAETLKDLFPEREKEGRIAVGDLPLAAVTSRESGTIEAKEKEAVKLNCAEFDWFNILFVGTESKLEFTNVPASRPFLATLKLTQNSTGGFKWSIPGAVWIGSEPSFSTAANVKYVVTVFLFKGEVYAWAGLEGPEGQPGTKWLSGTAAPKSEEGNVGDFYWKREAPFGFYGPKTSEGWGSLHEVKGEQGPTGAEGGFHPWEANNLKGWSSDVAVNTAGEAITAGVLFLTKVMVTPGSTLANLLARIDTKGEGLKASECFAGIYGPTGSLLGVTADQHTSWESTGIKEMALTAHESGSLKLGAEVKWVYAVFLANGTTMPVFTAPAGSSTPQAADMGLTASNGLRAGTILTGQKELPASITIASVAAFVKKPILCGVN